MGGTFNFTVKRVAWIAAQDALRAIRKTVFVDEQGVPEELEWDGRDDACIHVLAESAAGMAIGCGRLLPDGHIGRMAVLKPWRNLGIGGSVLAELIAAAVETGHALIVLNAQTHALKFYERYGFRAVGDEFMDAGIPHRAMELVKSSSR